LKQTETLTSDLEYFKPVKNLLKITVVTALCFTSSISKAQNDISDLIIPNVITPNGDGLNDRFEILSSDGDAFPLESAPTLIIYNRYGAVIFEATRYINQWDASELSDGRYFYLLQFRTGESYSGNIAVYH